MKTLLLKLMYRIYMINCLVGVLLIIDEKGRNYVMIISAVTSIYILLSTLYIDVRNWLFRNCNLNRILTDKCSDKT